MASAAVWATVALPPVAAVAATLPSGPDPLLGSTFQGGDGDQNDASPPCSEAPAGECLDWEAFDKADRVVHSPDKGLEFQSGHEDDPGTWRLRDEGTGGCSLHLPFCVSPAQANLLDAWSAVDQPGGDTFLYLGFTRDPAGGNGTTSTVFELNQDARTWDNDRNPATPEIPCRHDGDVLIRFDAHGNDPDVDVFLARWDTRQTDPTADCDRTGVLDTISNIPGGSAQGKTNPGEIRSFLPGTLRTINTRLFGETALNLTKLFGAAFDDPCFSFGSIWMHTLSSNSFDASLKDFIAPVPVVARSCAAAGTKFYDRNVSGGRDPGEPGVPRFVVWADFAPFNGVRDASEPFTVTDRSGNYVLKNIRPPGAGTYQLRETRLGFPAATSVRCSFPAADTPPDGFDNGVGGLFPCGWGPISPASEPFADNRDFGNWLPAHLTLVKELWPRGDPGRFDLRANGRTLVEAAPADGASQEETFEVRPGTYDISEAAVDGTNAGDYDSKVSCTTTNRRRGTRRSGTTFENLRLRPGAQAKCVFINVRRGAAAIRIEKTGPDTAQAGARLRYRLAVTNEGRVPLSDVAVTDPGCRPQPPRLVAKRNASGGRDETPATLDPGDVWFLKCSHATPRPPSNCTIQTIRNTATATGNPPTGAQVSDSDSVTTTLECPSVAPEPPLPPNPPEPEPPPTPTPPIPPIPPNPIVPPGPPVPPAGQLGRAGLRVRSPCIRRISDARVVGTHISRIQVRVNGRLVRRATLRILQRRATLLHRVIRPGRHRVAVHVTFARGSGTPPVTLRRVVRICGPAAPRPNFTG